MEDLKLTSAELATFGMKDLAIMIVTLYLSLAIQYAFEDPKIHEVKNRLHITADQDVVLES